MKQEQPPPLGELVIQYDPASNMMRKQLRGTPIPLPLLVNFLELLKLEIILQEMQLSQQAQQGQQRVVVPNGGPIPNLRS